MKKTFHRHVKYQSNFHFAEKNELSRERERAEEKQHLEYEKITDQNQFHSHRFDQLRICNLYRRSTSNSFQVMLGKTAEKNIHRSKK